MSVASYEAGYRAEHSSRHEYTRKLRDLLSELMATEGIKPAKVESRTKTVESFVEKATRDGKSYDDPLTEITDVSGVRVIVYYESEVDAVGQLIEREFAVDPDNSVDKKRLLDVDRFGYQSVHYVLRLGEPK